MDLRRMLPSDARQALEELILARMKATGLDWYADPKYRLVDALQEFSDQVWESGVVNQAFETAKRRYETDHPKCWDTKRQTAYRKGIE